MILIKSQLSRNVFGRLRGELPIPIRIRPFIPQIFSILLIAVFQSLLDFPATVSEPVVVVGDAN
jgi:hypothetical protein